MPERRSAASAHPIRKNAVRPRPILLFDFDGTVALGDGPVIAYAREVSRALGGPEGFLSDVLATLAARTQGLDGYDAVRVAAERAGADASLLSAAYLTSRRQLATPHAAIEAPDGLADFLANADAERILVTNAPSIRLNEALVSLGLHALFDRVISNAGKPAGLEEVLDSFPADAPVLSIGDIWRNDLEPAQRRGHATALVGGFVDDGAHPLFRAETLTALLPRLSEWLRDPHAFSPATPASHTPLAKEQNA